MKTPRILFFVAVIAFARISRAERGVEFPEGAPKASARAVAALSEVLSAGGVVWMDFGESVIRPKPDGRWSPEGLRSVLMYRGSYGVASEGLPKKGNWMAKTLAPRIVVIENRSSVHPLSKDMATWGLSIKVAEYEQVERSPQQWFDPAAWDMVVFSSPGWWGNFANPPSGPSRIPNSVRDAARRFVNNGGTAVFFDIAQWDLEKIWPKSIRLASLGPYQVTQFKSASGSLEGGLSLAAFGVAPEKLLQKAVVPLFYRDSFAYPDGNRAPVYGAYAFPDPDEGSGMVVGFAFHPFEQDDTFAGRSRKLLLNTILAAGARKTALTGEKSRPVAAIPTEVPTEIPTELPLETATFEPTPQDTFTPTFTEVPTKLPTSVPTATLRPTMMPPSPSPTRQPSPIPSIPPTELFVVVVPTSAPERRPTTRPTIVPTNVPAPSPGPSIAAGTARHGLGCLRSSPEPFGEGGAYVFFCIKREAAVRIMVYDAKGAKVFEGKYHDYSPGTHQISFLARDNDGKPIKSGLYHYRLEAKYDEKESEWKQNDFRHRKRGDRQL